VSYIVEVAKVTKDYANDSITTHALRGVSLGLKQGDFAAMAGPSGSGKTTLLNIIGGLDRPNSGSVFIEEKEITHLSGTELSKLRRDRIGFIFQSYNLIPVLTAYENAEYVLMLQGMKKEARMDRVMRLLKEVGLEGLERRFPRELSGGQQQRVAIARAIAPEPALVLADEPTANVDSEIGSALLDLMRHLNEQRGTTFLFSTHDRAVMSRAGRLIRLRDGNIIEDTQIL